MPGVPGRCVPFEEDLSALLDGELAAERAAEVRAHVDGCPTCGPRLEGLSAVDAALRGLEEPVVDADLVARTRRRIAKDERLAKRAPPRRRWLAGGVAAAAAALAVLALLPRLHREGAGAPQPTDVARVAPPTPPEVVPSSELDRRAEPDPNAAQGVLESSSDPVPARLAAELDAASDEEIELALDTLEELEDPGDLELIEQLGFVEHLDALEPAEREERAGLSDEERRALLGRPGEEALSLQRRMQTLRELPPDERVRVQRNLERWRELSPDQRDELRGRWRRFQSLPPEQQRRLREQLAAR